MTAMDLTMEELMLVKNYLSVGRMYSSSPEPIAKGIWDERKQGLLTKVEDELVRRTT